MINSAPRQPGKYKQGLYVPKHMNKLIKANSYGGLFYRSGLEHKMMIYLDSNENIRMWGAEHLRISYEKTEFNNKTHEIETTSHGYYPDFYYELIRSDGTISRVVAEVKASNETVEPKIPENLTDERSSQHRVTDLKILFLNISK